MDEKHMIKIEMFKDAATEDIKIEIRVPREHILAGRSTPQSRRIAELITVEQFFGMLTDVVNLKLGIEA